MLENKPFCLKNILTVSFFALLFGVTAFLAALWQTPHYKSTVKLLTVFNSESVDTYTASKTSNYITGILGEVIYSDSFINNVFASESRLIDNLGQGSEARQKSWNKKVKTSILDNKGIIIIDVVGNDKYQANLMAAAIGSNIVNSHNLYDGSGDHVTIKMIDMASIYENWSMTKIMTNSGLGLLAGLLLGLTLVIIFPNHKLFEFNSNFKPSENYLPYPRYRPAEIKNEPANSPITKTIIQPEITPATAATNTNHSINKITSPWLEEYYQENLPDEINRDK